MKRLLKWIWAQWLKTLEPQGAWYQEALDNLAEAELSGDVEAYRYWCRVIESYVCIPY